MMGNCVDEALLVEGLNDVCSPFHSWGIYVTIKNSTGQLIYAMNPFLILIDTWRNCLLG